MHDIYDLVARYSDKRAKVMTNILATKLQRPGFQSQLAELPLELLRMLADFL
jgi:hypothetical protein